MEDNKKLEEQMKIIGKNARKVLEIINKKEEKNKEKNKDDGEER